MTPLLQWVVDVVLDLGHLVAQNLQRGQHDLFRTQRARAFNREVHHVAALMYCHQFTTLGELFALAHALAAVHALDRVFNLHALGHLVVAVHVRGTAVDKLHLRTLAQCTHARLIQLDFGLVFVAESGSRIPLGVQFANALLSNSLQLEFLIALQFDNHNVVVHWRHAACSLWMCQLQISRCHFARLLVCALDV
jgi:hypothetical protein